MPENEIHSSNFGSQRFANPQALSPFINISKHANLVATAILASTGRIPTGLFQSSAAI